jgi:hypothetical protein
MGLPTLERSTEEGGLRDNIIKWVQSLEFGVRFFSLISEISEIGSVSHVFRLFMGKIQFYFLTSFHFFSLPIFHFA